MTKVNVQLGDKARDTVSGFAGVCRRLSHVSLFAVDEDVASIIMLALDAVQKATGKKP